MKTNTRAFGSMAVLALAAALAACAPTPPSAPNAGSSSGSEDKALTRIVVAPSSEMSAAWAAFAVAQDQGYFAEEGIEIELQWPGGSADLLQAMATGRVQIGGPTPEAVLAAAANGQDIKMTYNWSREAVQSLAVPADGEITSFADLKGGTIGVANFASGAKLMADAALRDAGVGADEVTFIAVGTGAAALDALTRGEVDALMIWDTEYTKMEQYGATLRYIMPEEYSRLFSTGFAAAADYIEENPDIVAGFGRAWAKGTVWATANPEGAVELLWEYYPQTKTDSSDTFLQEQVAIFEGRNAKAMSGDPVENGILGEFPPDALTAWVDFAVEYGVIPSPLDPASVYTNDFVEDYNDFDVAEVQAAAKSFAG
ncbi:ABC transporter substrate-binding protein [Cellulomonas dongxiuzhuiae]|uniref:ABC transporter substrate-binding protein n=1 Tax=Cellulomonas dongxiuzhuiae TaxID=2819979 RepID=UPI001AAE8E46|nr:ABC transporter substrate-binding protein [Cellulomonas dongxiuzhuiae]MBO3087137.1 ABC transporter substrate-binding protein [Cellulomonas dongxiuzhuiae]